MNATLARILHILAAAALYAIAGLEGAGIIHIAGTDPATLGIMATGLLGAGYTGPNRTSAAMIAALALACLCSPSTSEAQSLKAPISAATPAQPACPSPVSCTGFYGGGFIAESGGSLNIPATGLSGIASNQMAAGADIGWQYWDNKWFAAAELVAEYGIVQNGTVPGGGFNNQWGGGVLFKIGYNFFNMAAPTGPVLPKGMSMVAPYAILGPWWRPWGVGEAAGGGVEGWLAPGVTVNIDAIHVNYNNAMINPIAQEQSENMVLGGFHRHF